MVSANNLKDFAIIGLKQDEYSKIDIHADKEQVFQVNSLKGFAMFLNLNNLIRLDYLMKIFSSILKK